MFRERLKQALWQGPALIIMAGLIATGIKPLARRRYPACRRRVD